jgi:hypothetical protein
MRCTCATGCGSPDWPSSSRRWEWSISPSSRTSTGPAVRRKPSPRRNGAAGINGPAYAIDAQTAIKLTDGSIDVVSEGHWKLLNRHQERRRPSRPEPMQPSLATTDLSVKALGTRPIEHNPLPVN